MNNIKTVISFTTGSQDITKPDSIVKLSEGATCSKKENLEKSSFIGSFLLKDLTKAEIRWCMRTIMKQSGYNSRKKLEGLFCDMFPDSKIAEEFALCRPKASHVIYHGLSPFYKKKDKQLTPKDTEQPYFISGFDEAFISVSNQKQRDLHLINFNEHLQRTQRLYFNSQFMGQAQASDLIQSLVEILKYLEYFNKMVQASMDGSNGN